MRSCCGWCCVRPEKRSPQLAGQQRSGLIGPSASAKSTQNDKKQSRQLKVLCPSFTMTENSSASKGQRGRERKSKSPSGCVEPERSSSSPLRRLTKGFLLSALNRRLSLRLKFRLARRCTMAEPAFRVQKKKGKWKSPHLVGERRGKVNQCDYWLGVIK